MAVCAKTGVAVSVDSTIAAATILSLFIVVSPFLQTFELATAQEQMRWFTRVDTRRKQVFSMPWVQAFGRLELHVRPGPSHSIKLRLTEAHVALKLGPITFEAGAIDLELLSRFFSLLLLGSTSTNIRDSQGRCAANCRSGYLDRNIQSQNNC
jgi:hypothetical protein